MTRLRRAIGVIAITWLSCQVTTLALAPVILWIAAEAPVECLCTHGDHAFCPMHHKPAPGSKLCLMRSVNDLGTAVLTSVYGAVGLLPVTVAAMMPELQPSLAGSDLATALVRTAPPDPPPPRL